MTQTIELTGANCKTAQQRRSARGLETSNRRFRRLGIMPDQVAAIAAGNLTTVLDTVLPQAQEQQQDGAAKPPPADMFTVQRKQDSEWVHVTPPAKRARDLEAEATLMAQMNPTQQYRIAKPGAVRAVLSYNAR